MKYPLKAWWIGMRPFSFPASAMSVVFGTALAASATGASINWINFALALVGMVLLHGGANMLNDVSDYGRGLDRQVFPVSGAVVRGLLKPSDALAGAAALMAAGSLIGLYLTWYVGWPILFIGLLGVCSGLLYSLSAWGLKYIALGDLAVFLNFGILGSLGAWTVQTGHMSWLPVLWSTPISFLVIGILHANNWRDIASDTAGGIKTVASILGDRAALPYYSFLLFFPYLLVLFFILVPLGALPRMPTAFLLVFLSFPLAVRLLVKGMMRTTPVHPHDFLALDGATAQLNLLFGALYVAALLPGFF